MRLVSDYLGNVLQHGTKEAIVRRMTRLLRTRKDEFDAIAFRGMSGALVAPIVAMRLKKSLIMVRKDRDSNSCSIVEGALDCHYVIIDDMICGGKTVCAIRDQIAIRSPYSRWVGLGLYNDGVGSVGASHAAKYGVWVATDKIYVPPPFETKPASTMTDGSWTGSSDDI